MQLFILLVTILMGVIYPNFVDPLFNKFEEINQSELKIRINQLAESIQFPLTKILVMDGSKRSDHSNAYFFGQWKNKRIVLYDTLLQKLNDDEVLAVVGHELGHWKYQHTNINIFIFIIFIGSALFFAIFEPINQMLNLCELIVSRFFEFQADQFAHQLGLSSALISGLVKLNRENSTNLMIDPLYAWYYNSHPTLFERLNYLNKLNYD